MRRIGLAAAVLMLGPVSGCGSHAVEGGTPLKAYELARKLLKESAECMDEYHRQHGEYPTRLDDLASGNTFPEHYLGDMKGVFGEDGFQIDLDSSGRRYTLTGREKWHGQKVVLTGPGSE
jgi:hypothetical protein